MSKKIIGVFGGGRVGKGTTEWQAALQVGRLVAECNCIVLTGGLGGVMTAASKGAKEAGGTTIGILPGDKRTSVPNPYIDIAIYTGMGEARNVVNVKSCDAAIAIGGEYGTLSEIALALKTGCFVVFLNSWPILRSSVYETDGLHVVDAEEAVQKAYLAAVQSH